MTNLVSTYGVGFSRNIDKLPTFTGQELFHIFDIWDKDYIADVIQAKGLPGAILSCGVLFVHADHLHDIPYLGAPLWLMREARQWNDQDFDDDQTIETDYTFNFMVNKGQLSRSIMMRLVEIGDYSRYQYTWSGFGRNPDMSPIIKELDLLENISPVADGEFRSKILAAISLESKFLDNDLKSGDVNFGYGRINYAGNKWSWDHFLHDMFYKSCVALISETDNLQKLTLITEKTLYAFYGLNFPIWIGSYASAQVCEKLGFDVFSDVINHDYQWYPTLIERCYWAFELNKNLLHDLDRARDLRQRHRDRLLANRRLLLGNHLENYCLEQIDKFDSKHRAAALAVKAIYDTTQSNMTTTQDGQTDNSG